MPKQLWPDFNITPPQSTPKTIIEQAGEGLREKTKGLVVFQPLSNNISGEILSLQFALYARKLAYMFPFLTARFPIIEGYPVELIADKVPPLRAANEEELVDMLGRIFQSPSTIETVQRLISISA